MDFSDSPAIEDRVHVTRATPPIGGCPHAMRHRRYSQPVPPLQMTCLPGLRIAWTLLSRVERQGPWPKRAQLGLKVPGPTDPGRHRDCQRVRSTASRSARRHRRRGPEWAVGDENLRRCAPAVNTLIMGPWPIRALFRSDHAPWLSSRRLEATRSVEGRRGSQPQRSDRASNCPWGTHRLRLLKPTRIFPVATSVYLLRTCIGRRMEGAWSTDCCC